VIEAHMFDDVSVFYADAMLDAMPSRHLRAA